MTITEFLLARIAEDEAEAAKAGSFTPWDRPFERDDYGHLLVQPGRVLAECDAKRRIVEVAEGWRWERDGMGPDPKSDEVLRLLAQPYADHPDYREEWRL